MLVLSFLLFMWCIMFIDLRILYHSFILGRNPTLSWHMTFFNVLLDSVCWYFVENFRFYVYKLYWPIVFFLIFYCHSSTVVSICTPPFPPPLLPTYKPIPFGLVHVSCIHAPWWSFPYYPSPHSILVTVSLFFISMSLVLFCLLVHCVG